MKRTLDWTPEQSKLVTDLLQKHLPGVKAWAYGSRARWNARPDSDLDLVVFADHSQKAQVSALHEDLEESSLPYKVDLFVWDEVPDNFRPQIEKERVEVSPLAPASSPEAAVACTTPLSGAGPRNAPDWPMVRLDSIKSDSANAMSTGPFGSAISSKFFQRDGVPVIRGSNLSEDIGVRLNETDFAFVSPEKAKEFSRSIATKNDLVFTCWGTIGQVGIIDDRSSFSEYVISNKQMKLTPNSEVVSSLFLYYVLSSPEWVARIKGSAIGSSVPGFNLGQLKAVEVPLPPISVQKSIAHILGTLDDKIELNRRINQTLEEMAQTLFKSWFVDFDPVKAKASVLEAGGTTQQAEQAAMETISGKTSKELESFKTDQPDAYAELAHTASLFPSRLVESDLGQIPEGWTVANFGEYFDLTMGQSPPGDTYNESEDGLPFFQGRTDFGFRFPSRRVYCTAPTRLAKEYDILVSVRAPVGDVNVAWESCAIGRGIASVRSKNGHQSHCLYLLKNLKDEFSQFENNGTVFGAINKKQFEAIKFPVDSGVISETFESSVGNLDQMIRAREESVKALTAIRDSLLPKLLSGELEIPDELLQTESV